jgi:hypothetical protein
MARSIVADPSAVPNLVGRTVFHVAVQVFRPVVVMQERRNRPDRVHAGLEEEQHRPLVLVAIESGPHLRPTADGASVCDTRIVRLAKIGSVRSVRAASDFRRRALIGRHLLRMQVSLDSGISLACH